MATKFYKQTDDGEFVEADKDVDELFRQKSSEIVSSKLSKAKEKLREEIEDEVRKDALETVRSEARKELEAEYETKYKTKLEESESKAKQLDIKLRRKTIAAEYGFKPETEEFLGDGSDDDMRAKADTLKNSFGSSKGAGIEKTDKPKVSKLQEATGIVVEI